MISKNAIAYIIFAAVILLLTGIIFFQQGIIAMKEAEKKELYLRVNSITTDLEMAKREAQQKSEILENKEALLTRVREADTFKEYISVWRDLNK